MTQTFLKTGFYIIADNLRVHLTGIDRTLSCHWRPCPRGLRHGIDVLHRRQVLSEPTLAKGELVSVVSLTVSRDTPVLTALVSAHTRSKATEVPGIEGNVTPKCLSLKTGRLTWKDLPAWECNRKVSILQSLRFLIDSGPEREVHRTGTQLKRHLNSQIHRVARTHLAVRKRASTEIEYHISSSNGDHTLRIPRRVTMRLTLLEPQERIGEGGSIG